jgi:hypothetical protein
MIAVVIVPAFMMETLHLFLPVFAGCISQHRVYGLVAVTGPLRPIAFDGYASVEYFPTVEAAKAWVEQDVVRSLLPSHGSVS